MSVSMLCLSAMVRLELPHLNVISKMDLVRERNADGSWSSTEVIEEIEIPSSLLDLVRARVSRLSEDERHLLDVAACWGPSFDASLIGEALGLRRLPVLQSFARIESRDRLVRSEGRHFAFDHHQVQEVLYDALPEMLREEYHLALAEALEARSGERTGAATGETAVQLATHFLRGADARRAVPYLRDAIEHLSAGFLPARAAELAERVLEPPGLFAGEERAKILLRLAGPTGIYDALTRHDRWEELARELLEVAEQLDDDSWRGKAERTLGLVLH